MSALGPVCARRPARHDHLLRGEYLPVRAGRPTREHAFADRDLRERGLCGLVCAGRAERHARERRRLVELNRERAAVVRLDLDAPRGRLNRRHYADGASRRGLGRRK
jgi:hypothetical protein